jgi:hypothetical protein
MSAMLLLLLAASACAAAAHDHPPISQIEASSPTGMAVGSNAHPQTSNSSSHIVLRLVVLVLLPSSNSPALDLMGVASHLQAR